MTDTVEVPRRALWNALLEIGFTKVVSDPVTAEHLNVLAEAEGTGGRFLDVDLVPMGPHHATNCGGEGARGWITCSCSSNVWGSTFAEARTKFLAHLAEN